MESPSQANSGSGPVPAEWLTTALAQRFDEFVGQREKALEQRGVDGVHDVRVAIRRFRSLLGDLPSLLEIRELRILNKELKKEAKLLGEVRDQDVYAVSLRELAAVGGDETTRSGIQVLIDESLGARETAFRRLEVKLAKHHAKTFAERFSAAIEAIGREPHLFSALDLTTTGREVISKRLRALSRLGGSLYDPFDKRGLHKMRIAAKRLRYSAELFESVLGPSAQAIAAEAAKMQSLLGDVHDRDVWTASLSKLLKREGHSAAVHYVFSEIVKKRSSRYRSALELWNDWRKAGFLDGYMDELDRQNNETPRAR